ncbi:MAG: A/G-specific adenine glycosylase [Saprospiraceae bacterium]|nr:A/G-specific adenine glycosylase [Saprospiraceae bacterium]
MEEDKNLYFQKKILDWFATHHRPLPWKGVRNPYIIWLSEIILQQTTVAQGTAYFEKFRQHYPSVSDLANAPSDDVMKLWEGLGYYSRARNLHATAKHIATELNGAFPTTYEGILTLKGVGPYTAAAIASFAYDLPHAVVDGNVYRVLSRFFGIETPIDTTEAKHQFAALADAVLDKSRPADFNQAMMDFGATHCTPATPKCVQCPLKTECVAFKEDKVAVLPKKSKKMVRKTRFFNYLVINENDGVYIQKRTEKDIWQDLYEFPMIETDELADILRGGSEFVDFQKLTLVKQSQPYQQLLTHQKIVAVFWEFSTSQADILRGEVFQKIRREDLKNFAFPKIIDIYLKEKVLTLF